MRTLLRAYRRMLRDTAGNVAVMLALSLVPLSLAGIGALDLHRVVSAKSRLQDALDAAALTTARDAVRDPAKLQQFGAAAFAQNIAEARITVVSGPTFTLDDDRTVIADASARIDDTIVADLLLGSSFTVNAHSEVKSSGANIEVAVVLDVTGSMAETLAGDTQTKIAALRTAATQLVDVLVQDQQPPAVPFYSKMALVPYSSAVRPTVDGTNYAAALRGPIGAGSRTSPGWQNYTFTNALKQPKTFGVTDCVTERVDDHEWDDAPYTTALLGRHYANASECPSATVRPLTTDKALLKREIAALGTGGYTAGHIGLAWGWYLVSPRFMAPYPGASAKPAAYGTDKLIKVVVLMTDGNFNTAYYNGVAGRDSADDATGEGLVDVATSDPGRASLTIDHKADNGTSLKQAGKLCDAIKKEAIIIYAVGLFDGRYPSAEKLMSDCATDRAKVYLPRSGVQLKDAFASIGADITKLRLSR